MNTTALTNLIEQTVLDQMRLKASFTALDISNTLKFGRYPVSHREVAETVREIYDSGAMRFYDYERKSIPVVIAGGTKQASAFLYHFQAVKPQTYQTRSQDALPLVDPAVARDLSDSVPAGPAAILPRPARAPRSSPGSPRCRLRRDGALAVPKQIVAALGWPDGTRLTLRQDGGQMVIGSTASSTGPLTVWGGQRLRICRTVLSTASLSADTVTVEIAGSELRVGKK